MLNNLDSGFRVCIQHKNAQHHVIEMGRLACKGGLVDDDTHLENWNSGLRQEDRKEERDRERGSFSWLGKQLSSSCGKMLNPVPLCRRLYTFMDSHE